MATREVPEQSTLTEVLAGLAERGYDGSFVVDDEGAVTCRGCSAVHRAQGIEVEGLRRLEGASDPGDMAAVLAVRCPACGSRGSIVARYGPESGPGDEALLLAAADTHTEGMDVAEATSWSEPPTPSAGPDDDAEP